MGKVIDLVGEKFGELAVLERAKKPDGSRSTSAFWLCQCSCGNKKVISGNVLRQGKARSCGCLTSKLLTESHSTDLSGKRFGFLTVLSRAPRPPFCQSTGAYFLCRCDCGQEKVIMGKSLRNGKTLSCGCHIQQAEDISGQKFGKLTAIKRDTTKKYSNKKNKWICQCECGNFTMVSKSNLVSGITKSCGCLSSAGEEQIQKILEENKITYKKEYSFSDLNSEKGYPLRFDFAVFSSDKIQLLALIEFQGEQHYSYSGSKFFDNRVLQTDKQKKEYCLSKNIPLFCIPYWERNHLTLEKLFNLKYLITS